MRAKLDLAICLWARNEHEESLRHLRDMLKLNPNDNQGVRSILASYLLEGGLHEELAALLKAYKHDGSADWVFSRALLAFRLGGDNAKSRKALAAAYAQNSFVVNYITGGKKLPKILPPYYSYGNEDEAIHYAVNFHKGWDETPGAIAWFEDFARAAPNKAGPEQKKKIGKKQLLLAEV